MSGKKRPSKRRPGLSKRTVIIAALIVFVAIDVVLAALALGWRRDEPQTVVTNSSTQLTAPSEESQGPAEDEETLVDQEPSVDPEPSPPAPQSVPRLISVVSDTVAWRTEGGACDERGVLELTIDGGETWGETYPAADGLGRPLWVSGADYTTVQAAISSGLDCDAQGARTFDSGTSWAQDDQVIDNSVLVDPSDSSVVVWGGDELSGPCGDMTQVAVSSGVASVICGDGSVWSAPAGDTAWTEHSVNGAVALSGSEGRWIAAVESPDCIGLDLVELTDSTAESLACAPVSAQDEVALDLAGNTLWLWSGDEVLVSTDLGRSLD